MQPEISYHVQYRVRQEKVWRISSIWDTPEEAQRRSEELMHGHSAYEWRPVKVTTEVLPE